MSDALLDGLTEDMDLRVLLPSEGARVGDEWEVDVACLPEILSPGGYFAWTIQPGESAPAWSSFLDPALMGELRPVLGAMLEGHVTVKYAGHDAGYSQLELSVDVHSTQNLGDLEDLAAQIIAEFPDWGTVEISRLDLDFALQAKGAAEWNTTSGHIFDLALKGSLESELDLELVWDAGSGWCVEVRTAVSGVFEQRFDTE